VTTGNPEIVRMLINAGAAVNVSTILKIDYVGDDFLWCKCGDDHCV
jgi:hypothetical protein